MMMDKPEQARKYLQMAAASDPLNPTAHYRLAMTDKRLGLQDEAQKEAQRWADMYKILFPDVQENNIPSACKFPAPQFYRSYRH